jgi:hypothetical protein
MNTVQDMILENIVLDGVFSSLKLRSRHTQASEVTQSRGFL